MMAVVAPHADGAEELALVERPLPRAGRQEVLVKVAAAGVNRPDILQRRGLYPPPPGAPDILGLELAGEVVAAGRGRRAFAGSIRLRAGGRRRLCRILRRSGRDLPADPGGLVGDRGRGDAGNPVHRVGQSVRAGVRRRRRLGAGPWRHQRHRDDGDHAWQIVRPAHHRHLRQRGEMCAGARARGRRGDQLSRAGLRRGGPSRHRSAAASMWSSTWSAATMCRATSPA